PLHAFPTRRSSDLPDRESVVVVIDQFDRAGEEGSHLREDRPGLGGDRRRISGEERIELLFGGQIPHGRRGPLISTLPRAEASARRGATPTARRGNRSSPGGNS